MIQFEQYDMGLIGGAISLGIFLVFIGTWWWYGMRVHEARALVDSGRALLIAVDDPKEFAAHPIAGARNIPLAALTEHADELGPQRRPIVVCGQSTLGTALASRRLRTMGYRVIDVGAMGV